LTEETTESETHDLGAEGEEYLVAQRNGLAVENTLTEDDLGGVSASPDNVGHYGDANMLFDGERAWVEGPYIAKGVEFFGGEDAGKTSADWKRDKLGNNTGDVDRRN